jgi:hypothetical protein
VSTLKKKKNHMIHDCDIQYFFVTSRKVDFKETLIAPLFVFCDFNIMTLIFNFAILRQLCGNSIVS